MLNITSHSLMQNQSQDDISITSYPSGMVTIRKPQKITSEDKVVQQLEPLRTDGRDAKWQSCYGQQYGSSSKTKKKLKIELLYDPNISLLGICSKGLKTLMFSKEFAYPSS